MKVLIVGYGKMGKEIEQMLLDRNHAVVGKATDENPLNKEMLEEVDVAIDFSTPDVVMENIQFLLENHIPTVVGTTGWHKHYSQVANWVKEENGAFVHASNFSIGVNLFFQLNKQLSKLMAPYEEYTPEITEIHHTEKLDAPSGTAITLAEGLLENNSSLNNWYCPQSDPNTEEQNSLKIEAIRKADVKGTHEVTYQSTIDTLSIRHEAHNRKGFALGAVIAAEWIQNKKGIFTMKDVLGLS